MKKILLIADDYTGANDTGIKIAERGYEVEISLKTDEVIDSDICVIDTESRNISGDESRKIINKTLKSINNLDDYLFIYKKVDSTLRGNIKEECDEIIKYYKPEIIIFDPAYPVLGRKVIDGIHFVNDVRLKETEFAHDPEKPITEDDIRKIFDTTSYHHNLEDIRNGLVIKDGINTFDTELDSDLSEIAKKCLDLDRKILYIGSAGLCDAIFDELIIKHPALAIVGSVSKENEIAVDYCSKMGVKVLDLTLKDFLEDNYQDTLDEALETLKTGEDLVISTSMNRKAYEESKLYLDSKGIDQDKEFTRLIDLLVEEVIKKSKLSGLFITGGTTAFNALKALNASGTVLLRELEPGIIISDIKGLDKELLMVSKAGAFGNEKTIYNSLTEIRKASKWEKLLLVWEIHQESAQKYVWKLWIKTRYMEIIV